MIISIDTEKMNTMASLAQNVRAEIDDCVTSLIPVVEHNDWNCKERDLINDGIIGVKKNAVILQEALDSFSSLMKQVASLFDAFEASLPNKYQQIDAFLGSTFAIPCVESTVATGSTTTEVTSAIAEGMRTSGGLENNALGNLTNPIQVCNFDDLDYGKT